MANQAIKKPGISQPIQIRAAVAAVSKDVHKKIERLAYSCPAPKFLPPRAPTQRPRVPSMDPPPMTLPPSPLVEVPDELANLHVSEPQPVASAAVPVKRKPQVRKVAIYSSSAPDVSYMAKFIPNLASMVEENGGDVQATVAAALKNAGAHRNGNGGGGDEGVEEILGSVGSPTIFSLLRLESDRVRSASLASGRPPAAATSGPIASAAATTTTAVPVHAPASVPAPAAAAASSVPDRDDKKSGFQFDFEEDEAGEGGGDGHLMEEPKDDPFR